MVCFAMSFRNPPAKTAKLAKLPKLDGW
jgi:hypothetical protein